MTHTRMQAPQFRRLGRASYARWSILLVASKDFETLSKADMARYLYMEEQLDHHDPLFSICKIIVDRRRHVVDGLKR